MGCGGDLVPWGHGVMGSVGSVEETWCHVLRSNQCRKGTVY